VVVVVVVEVVVVVVVRYLDEALNKVSFDDSDEQVKLDQLLSYGLASELQCLRSRYFTSLALCDTVCQCITVTVVRSAQSGVDVVFAAFNELL